MDQFALMVDTLTDYTQKQNDSWDKLEEECLNESMALVESTLLHGYTITDISQYTTSYKRITEKVSV